MMIKQNGCNYSYHKIVKYLEGEHIYFYFRQVCETNTTIKIQITHYYSIFDTTDGIHIKKICWDEFPLPTNTGVKSIYNLMETEIIIQEQIFFDNGSDPCCVTAYPIDFLKNEFPIEINDDIDDLLFSDYPNENKEGFEILKSINNK